MSGPAPTCFQREAFELSRAMEFFNERELTAQIGHSLARWPVALLKELLDNALDACESANIPPVITVKLRDDALIVTDNGPGLPLATLEKSLDYSIRVSDKTGYVSPSRGQQGNALKTLWAAPFVATGDGLIEVETATYRRMVHVTLDRIAQVPRLELRDNGTPDVKTGTKITVHWRPDRPTAPHWYSPERFRTLWRCRVRNALDSTRHVSREGHPGPRPSPPARTSTTSCLISCSSALETPIFRKILRKTAASRVFSNDYARARDFPGRVTGTSSKFGGSEISQNFDEFPRGGYSSPR